MSQRDSSQSTIIVAILGMVSVICAATIGLGLPFSQKLADVIFSSTRTPIPTNTPLLTRTPVPSSTLIPTNTPQLTRTPIPTMSSLDFVDSIGSYAQDMRFYESDTNGTPYEQRVYSTSFKSETARYIWWELVITHPPTGQRIDFIIHAVYYKPDGSIFYERDMNTYEEPDWTSSYLYSGAGWDQPGNWEKGTYTVVLYVNNIEIARASFQII